MAGTPRIPGSVGRRGLLGAALVSPLLAGCSARAAWHGQNVRGQLPALQFTMQDVGTMQPVTARAFRGKVVLLAFGYTSCPDVCPTTLSNLGAVLQDLGRQADGVRVLFVTVDPDRDTPPVLRHFTQLFAPQVVGLRGTPDDLATLARRYRVGYSVTPARGDQPYEVTHSGLVFVFDREGTARLLVATLSTPQADLPGTAADLQRLLA